MHFKMAATRVLAMSKCQLKQGTQTPHDLGNRQPPHHRGMSDNPPPPHTHPRELLKLPLTIYTLIIQPQNCRVTEELWYTHRTSAWMLSSTSLFHSSHFCEHVRTYKEARPATISTQIVTRGEQPTSPYTKLEGGQQLAKRLPHALHHTMCYLVLLLGC